MPLSSSVNFLLDGLSVTSVEPGLAVVTVTNTLDIPAIVPFRLVIEKCINNGNIFVVIDLKEVSFMDSPFVGTLMGCRKMLQQKGGDLAICSVSQFLQDRLSLMGLDRVFHFYTSPQTAIADFHFIGSKEYFSFNLPLNRNCVVLLRRMVCSVLSKKGFKQKIIFHMETIIDELANNAVDYSKVDCKNFFLGITISRKKIVLVVKNTHNKLDKSEKDALLYKYQNSTIDAESSRGRGIPIVKMLSNSVNVDISQAEIIVQVTKIVEV